MEKLVPKGSGKHLCAAAFLLTCVAVVILASVPPVSRDALTHHLAVPKLYIKHGAMVELPYLKCSYYPELLDLLYMIPLYFGNDVAAKYIHFAFAIGTALLLWGYLKTRLSVGWGCFGALFFLTIPIIVKLGITVYVDLGLIFFSTASMLGIISWRQRGYGLPRLVFAAVLAGLAAGTKYNGLIVIMLLSLFIPFVARGSGAEKGSKGVVAMIIFFAVSVAVFSPWMVRNYRWTGNPVYPLYGKVFEKQRGSESEAPSGGMTHMAARRYVYNETPWQTATIPIRIFFQGKDDDPKFFDGVLSPFLLIMPFFAFLGAPEARRWELRFFAWFSALYILIVFLKIDMRIRYVAPSVAPLVILSVFGLHNLATRLFPRIFHSGRAAGFSVAAIAASMLLFNYRYIAGQFEVVKPLSFLSGKISRDDYISEFVREYPLVRYINDNAPADARVLALFIGGRIYYFDRDVRFEKDLFKPGAPGAPRSARELRDALKKEGFTHIIVRYDLFNNRVRRLFDPGERAVIAEFFEKFAVLLDRRPPFGLYLIKG